MSSGGLPIACQSGWTNKIAFSALGSVIIWHRLASRAFGASAAIGCPQVHRVHHKRFASWFASHSRPSVLAYAYNMRQRREMLQSLCIFIAERQKGPAQKSPLRMERAKARGAICASVRGLRAVDAAFARARFAYNRKNTTVSTMNSGMRIAHDQPIYPKNVGIFTFARSAMDFTMKLGALPM